MRQVHFIIHDLAGNILMSGSCPEASLQFQNWGEGTCVMETSDRIDTEAYYVRDGRIVSYPDKAHPDWVFDYTDHIWIDPLSLTDRWGMEKLRRADEARAYLAKTDWYVTRFNDPGDGRPIPGDVMQKRKTARDVASA